MTWHGGETSAGDGTTFPYTSPRMCSVDCRTPGTYDEYDIRHTTFHQTDHFGGDAIRPQKQKRNKILLFFFEYCDWDFSSRVTNPLCRHCRPHFGPDDPVRVLEINYTVSSFKNEHVPNQECPMVF